MNQGKPNHSGNLINFKIIALILALCAMHFLDSEVCAMQKPKHIVLLGASVGKAWNIEALPNRMSQPNTKNSMNYRFEYVGEYQFDKSNVLQQILKRKENKPDAIFIKECAAYFPGDFGQYQKLMKGWIEACKQAGVIPIPTTVVPVIRDTSLKTEIKDYIKRLIGRSPSTLQLPSILEYNDWMKSYAQKEGLIILDLEAPLRTSETDRSLNIDLHAGDGLHLNEKAYRLLDRIVFPTLSDVFRKK